MDLSPLLETHRLALLRLVMALGVAVRIGAGIAGGEGVRLPRHLRLALARLVRPAEAVARRLVVMAARIEGLEAAAAARDVPRPARRRAPRPRPRPAARVARLPLADPFPDPARRHAAAPPTRGRPRITFLDESPAVAAAREAARAAAAVAAAEARRVRPEDATRLVARLGAIRAALDDLPGEVLRLMRWHAGQARRAGAGKGSRLSPLRHGRPRASPRRHAARHALHDLLDRVHEVASASREAWRRTADSAVPA